MHKCKPKSQRNNYNIYVCNRESFHNNKTKILETLKSRCIQFKLSLSHKIKEKIVNSITENGYFNVLNSDFKNYYSSPSQYINFYYYCKSNDINFEHINIDNFLKDFIYNYDNKKKLFTKDNLINFIELFFAKKFKEFNSKSEIHDFYGMFIKKIYYIKKYNLDLESLLIEIKSKLIHE